MGRSVGARKQKFRAVNAFRRREGLSRSRGAIRRADLPQVSVPPLWRLRSREVRLIAAWSWAEAECIQSASPAIVADGISGAKKAGGLRRPCDEPRGESYEPDSRRHRRMP